eukprot:1191940-Prorocentrum_minimum.AAC.1
MHRRRLRNKRARVHRHDRPIIGGGVTCGMPGSLSESKSTPFMVTVRAWLLVSWCSKRAGSISLKLSVSSCPCKGRPQRMPAFKQGSVQDPTNMTTVRTLYTVYDCCAGNKARHGRLNGQSYSALVTSPSPKHVPGSWDTIEARHVSGRVTPASCLETRRKAKNTTGILNVCCTVHEGHKRPKRGVTSVVNIQDTQEQGGPKGVRRGSGGGLEGV